MSSRSGAFPLQKVLEFRKHLEDLQAIKLGRAQAEKIEADARLERLKRNKEDTLESAARELNRRKTLDLQQLKIQKDYLESLNGKIVEQTQEVFKLEEKVEKNRQELSEAMKERKTVEKLKERFLERQKTENKRRENQKTDEVAIRMNVMRAKKGA